MHPTIVNVTTHILDIPTIRPHKMSVATMQCQSLVLVRIETSDGIEGLGEATTIGGLNYGGESPESIKANIDAYNREDWDAFFKDAAPGSELDFSRASRSLARRLRT